MKIAPSLFRVRVSAAAAIVLVALTIAGCKEDKPADAAEESDQVYLNHAQPKLQTLKLWLGKEEVDAEIALTSQEVATGMMFRKEMGENDGMLFVFGVPMRASFYMRNTYLPLSCAYIDPEGVVQEVHDMKPLDDTPILAVSTNIQYVLEVKQGWFQRHHIGPGVVVGTERGTLRQTFFNRR